MPNEFDVIVMGAGVVGLSTAYHLAKDGKRVLVLEQFAIGHEHGQSYGESRAFSLAYETAPRVKLALQSRSLWQELERLSGEKLLLCTGGIDIVDEESGDDFVPAILEAMGAYNLCYEEWDPRRVSREVPVWRLPRGARVLYSQYDGFINAGRTVSVLSRMARKFGAVLKDSEPVTKILSCGSGFEVVTEGISRSSYRGQNLVVACGIWTNKVLVHLNVSLPIQTTQEQTVYFCPRANFDAFTAGRFPIWHHHKKPLVYGFPIHGACGGIKLGFHQDGFNMDIDRCDYIPRVSVTKRLRSYLEEYLPDAAGTAFGARMCLYDNTPDQNFIVDRIPGMSNVFVGAGFSGKGFNSAIATGRALADLVIRGNTEISIGQYRLDRF